MPLKSWEYQGIGWVKRGKFGKSWEMDGFYMVFIGFPPTFSK